MSEDGSISKIRSNKNGIPGSKNAIEYSGTVSIILVLLLTMEYAFYESISTYSLSMSRPFPDVYYEMMVPRQQRYYESLHCVPFQNKRLYFHVCLLSRKLLVNCAFILAIIIKSKLGLISSRFVAKVVLDSSQSTSFGGDSLSICVNRLRSCELVFILVLTLDLNLRFSASLSASTTYELRKHSAHLGGNHPGNSN